ncbi:MTH1187 family thiamine-binding protein [Gorillibacterium sp. CAU 1737]|uniref:thiamine-binding protein n=1 Tax=Gorillibacterium sp. CAU 1737 TaxID=3140362 RepID=UPI003261734E
MADTLLSIQIIPKTPNGEDVIPYVDRAIEIIQEAGIKHRVGPLETTMEGSFEEMLAVVKRMNDAMVEMGSPSIISQVKIYHNPAGASIEKLTEKYDG